MKLKLFLAGCIVLLFSNCKKDGKGCWQAFDPQGYDAPGLVVCDKTKAEAEAAYPLFWFYKQGEKKYCWKVNTGRTTSYTGGIPESMAEKFRQENGHEFTKVDCASFCTIQWHERHKSKITGQFRPIRLISETILSADSCNKLSIGRLVVMRETADSIITRELVKKFN